ncbi:uncharacterized protein [Apostichopus japonicus]|uniref:uncharacterized protein isoform X1 n=1 Tax=Stichopus japonicus TaxID=307972 RepID=UPI003AB46A47
MSTMMINILTEPEARGLNHFCYGVTQESDIVEVFLVTVGKSLSKTLGNKINKGKFYIINNFSLNKREDCTYLRLPADKAKVFQTSKTFDLPKEKLKEFFMATKCTIPDALASPKKRRLTIEGTVDKVYELKEGATWKRRDVILSDVSTKKKICCKLWGQHAESVAGVSEGSTVQISNVEVDIFNERHQLKTTSLSAVKILTNQQRRSGDFEIVGVDLEENTSYVITECGNTFKMLKSILEKYDMSPDDLLNVMPVKCHLTLEGEEIVELELK